MKTQSVLNKCLIQFADIRYRTNMSRIYHVCGGKNQLKMARVGNKTTTATISC